VQTSQSDYAPGSTAIFYGSGFQAGEAVAFHVEHIDSIYRNHYPTWIVMDGSSTPEFTDAGGVHHLPIWMASQTAKSKRPGTSAKLIIRP